MPGDDYSSWLAELDSYAKRGGSTGPGAGGGSTVDGGMSVRSGMGGAGMGSVAGGSMSVRSAAGGSVAGHSRNTVEEIEAEMKLLHWHKLANEAALKAALIRTKRLRDKDRLQPAAAVVPGGPDKRAWMERIIEEEQSKPLEVNDDFIRQYEQTEREQSERLEQEVQRHIANLQQLKTSLQKRDEERRRVAIYKQKKAMLQQGLLGSARPGTSTYSESGSFAETDEYEGDVGNEQLSTARNLEKLVELERRIAHLEERPHPASGGIVFHKKRAGAQPDAPARTYYSVQVVDKNAGPGSSRSRRSEGSVGSHDRSKRQQARADRQARDNQRNARQDVLINNWLKERKTKQASRKARVVQTHTVASYTAPVHPSRALGKTAPAAAPRGARTAPKPQQAQMQHFHDIRRQFEQTKSGIRSNLSKPSAGANSRGGRGDSSNMSRSRQATGRSFQFSNRASTGAEVGSRLGSSMPARGAPNRQQYSNNQSRGPARGATATAPKAAWGSQNSNQNRAGPVAGYAVRQAGPHRPNAQTQGRAPAGKQGPSKGFGGSSRFAGKPERRAEAPPAKFGLAGQGMVHVSVQRQSRDPASSTLLPVIRGGY